MDNNKTKQDIQNAYLGSSVQVFLDDLVGSVQADCENERDFLPEDEEILEYLLDEIISRQAQKNIEKKQRF